MNNEALKNLLDDLYNCYRFKYSSKDPVWNLHRFSDERDIEIIGLITSAYAYGQVDQINKFISKLLENIGNKPYEFSVNFGKRKDKKFLKGLNYRFNIEEDLVNLFSRINAALKQYGSLKNLFMESHEKDSENVTNALTNFCNYFQKDIRNKTDYYNYLIPNPKNNSACKRMNLYLRWMVRKDEIDFGIWNGVLPSKLIMPVDTHIARIAKRLNLVKRKSVDLKFALELTNKLKQLDADDPVKYDFALCHYGIEKQKLAI